MNATKYSQDKKLKALFELYDENKDGTLSKEEISHALFCLDEEAQKALDEMDENHDGKINYEEFVNSFT